MELKRNTYTFFCFSNHSDGTLYYHRKNKSIEVKSTYSWNTENEFERFMRFAKRYANTNTNY